MKREQARRLVERIGVLRNACDLDLLLFFVRHPRALLTSEQIAASSATTSSASATRSTACSMPNC